MSSGHKTVTGFCTVLLGLVLALVGLVVHWPVWAWAVATLVFAALALALPRLTTPAVDPLAHEFTAEPDRPTDPPERREHTVTDVVLPSAAEDYDFRFSATVRWWPQDLPKDSPPFSSVGVAVSAVLERARAVTESWQPERASLAQHRLVGELAVMLPDPAGRLLAMAENVTLGLAEADAVRLRKLATVRKDEVLWSHERRYERDRREYLGKDVLRDAGSAVVWWLAKNDDQIHKAVDDLGVLAQLSAAANDKDVPDRYAHLVPHRRTPETEDRPGGDPGHNGHHGMPHPCEPFTVNGSATPEPVNAFERLLATMDVPTGHEDSGVLARALHEGAAQVGREQATEAIRQRFDPGAAREPEPPDAHAEGGWADAPEV
ncbi:hypothetical protein [Streptomyces sp. 891-h]|uniref:hypothetical protein n=1 Tax=Streptomyces sp. 891-h TaxID=2720714 RepID=UPI001FA9983E|nr:hypothetical protein [Streptomyces sp. 891-h]UNZ20406.1 hypothetical protein HC362_28445 [Streptomyces sp. 891-h]